MQFRLKPLDRQVIVITGASSGIGLVTARTAARRGAQVLLVARNEPVLAAIVREITADGGRAGYAVADVGDRGAVEAAAAQAIERFGRIDSWVNCAGVMIYGKLADIPDSEHQRLFQTNYFGVVHGALTALKHLRDSGGAIITVGSIAGDLPSAIMGAYAASKHAVKGFIDSLRIEINADALPVVVTLIKPSGIGTPIGVHAANHLGAEARVPPPVYDPQLVADTILEAAVKPRRAVTVGGVGRLQVLAGVHFPGLLARFGGLLIPLLSDPAQAPTLSANLEQPIDDGHERSPNERGRRVSSYRLLTLHPVSAAVCGAAIGVAVLRAGWRVLDRQE